MRRVLIKVLALMLILAVASSTLYFALASPATQYDWISGRPAQTDNTNFDWVGGRPFIRYERPTTAAPTVTLSAATNVESTTATLNGDVTATGGENSTVTVYWGDNDGGQVPGNWDNSSAPTDPAQPQGVAAFYKNATALPTGTVIYFSAKATNSGGTGWPAASLSFLTKPAAPTGVSASDGASTSNVTVTFNAATGASDYYVYRDGGLLGATGNLTTYDDAGAAAPTITAGVASASDGTSVSHVTLSLAGESSNGGASASYTVIATNASGNSTVSAADSGYRGGGALSHQWWRSAADSDANYSVIVGGTTDPYNDTGAPADGSGRYYIDEVSAPDAVTQNSTSDRGFRMFAPTVTNGVGASNITSTSARLNGEVTSTGGTNPTAVVYWGVVDGADVIDNWTSNSTLGVKALGIFSYDTGAVLVASTTYFYRMRAYNAAGEDWANSSANFTTLIGALLPPTNFTAVDIGSTTASLSWNKGFGATNTLVRVKRSGYPTSITDGEQVYFDTGTSANDTGLSLEVSTYYYSAWSESGGVYSSTYATTSIGGSAMLLLGLIVLALTLTVIGYIKLVSILTFAGAGAWMVLGVYAYTQSSTPTSGTWDIYYALFWLSVGLTLASALMPALQRTPRKDEAGDIVLGDIERQEKDNDDLWRATQIPRVGRRGYISRRRRESTR